MPRAAGNVGSNADVSYENGRATEHEFDPYLVIGAEKHDADPVAYPSYRGWIDEVRLSTTERYTGSRFTRPFSAFSSDASTAALYHLDEGAGDAIGDASGGGSGGVRRVGGDPAGPEWSSETAPLDSARRVALEEVVSGAGRAVAIAHAGDDRLFVVDANGRILAYRVSEEGPFELLGTYLDIQDRVLCCGERGLLGLAFHPSFATNRYFFVYYTRESDGDIVIARYRAPTAASNLVDPSTERILLTIEHSAFSNHNGGGIAFGPDGYLYVPVGDGGGGGDPLGSGQSVTTHLGKLLRLAVNASDGGGAAPYYTIPTGNPFAASAGSEKKEIWAWGLRNPWRISFDRLTGDLFIADVGQNSREEVNLQLAGSVGGVNYGWPRMEGIACFNPGSGCQTGSLALPILDYSHGDGCSITGGYRYRGQGIPTLHGVYVFGDFCSKRIWAGTQSGAGSWSRATLLDTALSISSFGEDAAGELYVVHVGGSVHRFVRVRPRLTVMKAGNGAGTVTGPGGLTCGASCSVEYEPGQMITLTASPGATSWLAGWSGGCGGTESCAVLMDGDRSVTATFSLRPILQFSASSYTVSEGSGAATITVQRLGTTAGTATVDYAIEPGSAATGADFTGPGGVLTGTLTFTPGQSSKTFTVPVVNDGQIEGPETVLLSLHQPTAGGVLGTPSTAVLTIVDNDVAGTIQFNPATLAVGEAAGSAVLTVTRNQTSTGVMVNWAVVPEGTTAVHGTDYGGPTSGQLDFGAELSRPITIPLLNPEGFQGSRTLRVQLSNPSNGAILGAQKIATLTITDDEIGLQFSQPSYAASEGSASITIPVIRTGPAGAATVAFAAGPPGSGVAATASAVADSCSPGADYVPVSGTLSFGAGDMSKTFTVMLCKDALFEATPKIVGLALSSPQPGETVHLGPRATANLTINNVDVAGTLRWSASTYSVNEGSGPVVLTVTRSGGMAGGVTVDYVISGASATAGVDFTGPAGGPLTGTLAFGPNVTSRTLAIPVSNDADVESNETLTVTLQNVQGGASIGSPGVATVTIVDNDRAGTIQFSQAATTAQEDASASVTVTRTGSTSPGASVGYTITGNTASVDQTVTPLTGTVAFAAGQGSRPLSIKLLPDTSVDGNSTLTVTLHTPSTGLALGAPNPATVTLVDNEGTVVFAAPTFTVGEGNDFATITLNRTGGIAQPTTVHFATGGGSDSATPAATPGACTAGADYRPILDGSLTFNPGQTTRTFTVPLCRDTVVESPNPETLTLRLLSATAPATLGAQSSAILEIVENDAGGVLRFSSATYSVTEGTPTATLTVLRANGAAGDVTVPWSLGGNAVLNTDYGGPTSGQLAFGQGQTSASLSIPILNDALLDGVKNVIVTLGAPTGGATLGSPSVATLGIKDNEPSVRFSSATYNVNESSTGVGVTVIRDGSTASTVTLNVKTTTGGTATAGTCGAGADFTAVNMPVIFTPGQTSRTVTIPLCPDAGVEELETIALVLDNVAGATSGTPSAATVRIAENDVAGAAQFAGAASSVSETEGTANVLVTRSGGTASGLEVHWTITGGTAVHGGAPGPGVDYTGPTSGVSVFAQDEVSRSIPIPVWPRAASQGPRSVTLVLDSVDGGGTLGARTTTTLWILDADLPEDD